MTRFLALSLAVKFFYFLSKVHSIEKTEKYFCSRSGYFSQNACIVKTEILSGLVQTKRCLILDIDFINAGSLKFGLLLHVCYS